MTTATTLTANLRDTVTAALLLATAFVFMFLVNPSQAYHHSSLMSQVNMALRQAGLPVTTATQQSFAVGVANGHYTSYTQMVNAMKWHKAQGRYYTSYTHPVMAKPMAAKKVMTAKPAKKMASLMGEVTTVNPHNIQVHYVNGGGFSVNRTFDVSRASLPAHDLRPGSNVQVWFYWGTNMATRVKDLAPTDLIDVWGDVGCPDCLGEY